MKHEFRDELRIKVDHEHDIDPEVAGQIIDKVVEGAVTIIAIGTLSHFLKKIM